MSSPKDTIQSMQSQYHNPYRMDPHASQMAKVAKETKTWDSKETAQQKYERELTESFMNNNFRLPEGSVLLFAQLGRYFVLSLIYPPYFVFFRAPKAVLQQLKQLLKPVYESIDKKAFLSYQKVAELYEKAMSQIKGFSFSFANSKREGDNLFQILGKEVLKGFQEIMKSYEAIQNRISSFFESRFSEISSLFFATQKQFSNLFSPIFQTFQNTSLKIQQFFNRFTFSNPFTIPKFNLPSFSLPYEKAAEKMSDFLKMVKDAVKEKFVEPLKTQVEKIKERIEVIHSHIQNTFQMALETVVQYVAPIVPFAVGLISPPLQQFLAVLNKTTQGFAHFQAKTKQVMTTIGAIFKSAAATLSKPMLSFAAKVSSEAYALLQRGKKKSQQIIASGIMVAVTLISHLRKFPSWLLGLFKRIMRAFLKGLISAFSAIRLTLTWIKILVLFSLKKST